MLSGTDSLGFIIYRDGRTGKSFGGDADEEEPEYSSLTKLKTSDSLETLMSKMTLEGSAHFFARLKKIITVFRDRFTETLL
jgi:hypothetical protein